MSVTTRAFVPLLLALPLAACNNANTSAQRVDWTLPEPTPEMTEAWGNVPAVPNYARTYLYIPAMLESTDPFLIAVSGAGHLEHSMVWMIKVVVSAANECQYCLSQAVIMARAGGRAEDDIVKLQTDIDATTLTDKEKALLRLALTLTQNPAAVAPDVEAARAAGWTDEQLAQTIHVAAAWNYTNRFVAAFGVQRDWLHPFDADAQFPIRTAGTEAERQYLINFLSGGGE